MATTTYSTSADETVKVWSKLLNTEINKALELSPLMGKDPNANAIVMIDDLQRSAGDRVRHQFVGQLEGEGVTEGEMLEGTEETQATFTQDIEINELFKAVDLIPEGSITEQRVIHNLRSQARTGLRDWFSTHLSVAFFLHASGCLASSVTVEGTSKTVDVKRRLFNTIVAPSSGLVIYPDSANNNSDDDLDSGDPFTLSLIDKAKVTAELANPKIKPFMVQGQKKYVCYLHPHQIYQLRTDTSAGNWQDFAKNAGPRSMQAEKIYQGAIGEYNGVVIRQHEHVAPGYNPSTLAEITTVRRAVFLGASACAMAFGRAAKGEGRYYWREQDRDYERKKGLAVGSILGMNKIRYNSKDYGAIVIPTYASL